MRVWGSVVFLFFAGPFWSCLLYVFFFFFFQENCKIAEEKICKEKINSVKGSRWKGPKFARVPVIALPFSFYLLLLRTVKEKEKCPRQLLLLTQHVCHCRAFHRVPLDSFDFTVDALYPGLTSGRFNIPFEFS